MATDGDDWDRDERRPAREAALHLSIHGYDGPLHLLLELARAQKVDIARISILELADAYLEFVREAEALRIDLAGDYLVMASDLALLRSKLLYAEAIRRTTPPEELARQQAEAEAAAHARQMQLQRLDQMQRFGAALFERHRLGIDVFPRGMPEDVEHAERAKRVPQINLLDLIKAYMRIAEKELAARPWTVRRQIVVALADGLKMLRSILAAELGWRDLFADIPDTWRSSAPLLRSGIAATFLASLEMAKRGEAILRQKEPFGPIEVRGVASDEAEQ